MFLGPGRVSTMAAQKINYKLQKSQLFVEYPFISIILNVWGEKSHFQI
jgi:hypothetical protein